MNIREKVHELLKYCSSYQGHSYMVDERRVGGGFQVTLPEEEEISENLDRLQFILLTGEAGDGKSYLLRRLDKKLKSRHFRVFRDFSELSEQGGEKGQPSGQPELGKKEVMQMIADIVGRNSDERIIIAANVGIFTKTALMYQERLLDAFDGRDDRIRIFNFEKRNLAGDKTVFERIVKAFFTYDGKPCTDGECPYQRRCPYKKNLDFLSSPEGIESVRVLCDTVFLTGNHITFRELLSLLAHMVTLGESCEERKAGDPAGNYGYETVFELTEDKVLEKISRMDPAYKRRTDISEEESYQDIESCKREKRLQFFEAGDKYRLLAVDYLSEFQTALHAFEETPYLASEMLQDGVLYQLKRGIGRLTRRGESNLALKVADTPSILGEDIQTEFELGNMDIVWHRYGLDFNRLEEGAKGEEQNCFGMSYVYPADEKEERLETITLAIDYKLFRYLMMADEYFYLSHNSKSIEEYTINTFFRKILKKKQGAYEKMLVKFVDQERDKYCNFSLSLQKMSRFLYGKKKIIKLKKESS